MNKINIFSSDSDIWLFRDDNGNEYKLDWSKKYNQNPEQPKFDKKQLQTYLLDQEFKYVSKNNYNPFDNISNDDNVIIKKETNFSMPFRCQFT